MFDRNSEDFLWYVNFGITKAQARANKEAALEQCINKAYEDSCRHIDYLHSVSDVNSMKRKTNPKDIRQKALDFDEKKKRFKNTCATRIKNSILVLLSPKSTDYDEWHKKLCTGNDYLNYIPTGLFGNKSSGLTIGQRQKWVNMSVKNMLVMGLWDNELLRYKDKIHVPIDDRIQAQAKSIGIKTFRSAWNNINDYEDYFRFQTELRKKVKTPPIIWEWDEWIK